MSVCGTSSISGFAAKIISPPLVRNARMPHIYIFISIIAVRLIGFYLHRRIAERRWPVVEITSFHPLQYARCYLIVWRLTNILPLVNHRDIFFFFERGSEIRCAESVIYTRRSGRELNGDIMLNGRRCFESPIVVLARVVERRERIWNTSYFILRIA